jgi:hypothetical protein
MSNLGHSHSRWALLQQLRQLLSTVAASIELLKMNNTLPEVNEACDKVRTSALELESILAHLGGIRTGKLDS